MTIDDLVRELTEGNLSPMDDSFSKLTTFEQAHRIRKAIREAVDELIDAAVGKAVDKFVDYDSI